MVKVFFNALSIILLHLLKKNNDDFILHINNHYNL